MDQVFTLSGTKHIPLQHRFVRLRLDLLAVWHRVLHRPIFNNEKATIADTAPRAKLLAQDGFGSFASILPSPPCRPLSTIPDITDRELGGGCTASGAYRWKH